jgi:penicillin-binding protein 2
LVAWRLFDLQIVQRDRYAPLAEQNRFNVQILPPRRGQILDRNGRPLADNQEIFRVTLTPVEVDDLRAVLAQLHDVVPLTNDEMSETLARIKKQSRYSPAIVASDLTFEQIAKLNLLAPSLPGIATETTWRRRYHGRDSIGHVVGFVGSVERFGVNDDPLLRLPDMRVGKSGVEAGFEKVLRGSGGTEKIEVDARGRRVRTLETIEPVNGRNVTLSIDADLQQVVFSRLQKERTASAIVFDVRSGETVVCSSAPSFDPARIADGISAPDWQSLMTAPDKPLINRVVSSEYAPGSAFKPVTALAALDASVVSAEERIQCPGHYTFANKTYRCWNPAGHGDLTIHEALRCSCDVFFYEIARRAGIARIAAAARQLGLGAIHDIGLTEEEAGVVPDPDWKRGNFNAAWRASETLMTGIGQGYLQATPLQLALMTARIAGGQSLVPTLEKRNLNAQDQTFRALAFKSEHLDIVRGGMRAAVNEDGGNDGQAKLGDGRPAVAGQSGTSARRPRKTQMANEQRPWQKRDHAIFIAYMPADAPRYAIATVIEHGGKGENAGAVLTRDILNLVLDRDDRSHAGNSAVDGKALPRAHMDQTAG